MTWTVALALAASVPVVADRATPVHPAGATTWAADIGTGMGKGTYQW